MKHLKSSLYDLHELFDRSVSVRHLAEPFVSFDAQRLATEVRAFMEAKNFDIVGVRYNGAVVGYVERATLKEGTLEQYRSPFDKQLILNEWSPILEALQLLAESSHVFVVAMGEVAGIITKGDLQKAPMRMWFFGVLSLLEMQFLRLIRAAYPQDSWKSLISPSRIEKAQQLLQDRQRRNEAIDCADCLQFADKRTIVVKSDRLCHVLGCTSKGVGEDLLEELEHLRDELAHAQDIITGRWPRLVELAKKAEQILAACEALEPEPTG
jgi:hypothetical protein